VIAPHLIIDLRCQCGYNVRSLAIDGVCAECGFPIPDLIFRTKTGHLTDEKALINEQRRAKRRQKYDPLATKTGCTIDAFLFIVDAIRHSYRRGSLPARDFNANDLCAAVERYARFHFHHISRRRKHR
jgi:hypothetical protein